MYLYRGRWDSVDTEVRGTMIIQRGRWDYVNIKVRGTVEYKGHRCGITKLKLEW